MAKEVSRKQSLSTSEKKNIKFWTRNKSIAALVAGADPTTMFRNDKGNELGRFTDHPSSHVKRAAWKKMGKPLPEDKDEATKFLATLHLYPKAEVVAEQMTETESAEGHASDPPQPVDEVVASP
jgi:hypothetical protein